MAQATKLTPLVFLDAIESVLSEPIKWTIGVMARDSAGNKVSCLDKHAVCFCLEGAIVLAQFKICDAPDSQDDLFKIKTYVKCIMEDLIVRLTKGKYACIPNWNDMHAKNFDDVKALLADTRKIIIEDASKFD